MEIIAYSCIGNEQKAAEDARREIENGGYRIKRWFADEAAPGPRSRAPRFTEMLHHLQAGDTIVVTKLHHLGSNAEDVLATLQALDAQRIDLIVLELGAARLQSDAGRLMLKTLSAVVDIEKNRVRARAKPCSEPARSAGKRSGRAGKLPRELRAKIITDYCQGVGVTELARRYDISRPRIQEVVDPKRKDDEPLPFAWGD
ncbi:recombinase family protein [Noviherbaspirillum sp.]|uniref:recombinase family protein n=1 Tax=Noviherbaspirillum sp. TaxID=1926288 RepID=UPI002D68A036|nr:recombinase family protein [Noviherbaspirillum sp.]HZW19747.1 recombinase family protein [Noviherbaspirillum sp.]